MASKCTPKKQIALKFKHAKNIDYSIAHIRRIVLS